MRLAQRDRIVFFPYRPFGVVKLDVLAKNNGIVVANRGHQQTLGIVRIGWRDTLEPGDVRKDRVVDRGMLTSRANAAPDHRSYRERNFCLPAKHVAQLGAL